MRAGGYALGDGARTEVAGRRQRDVALSLSRAVSRATSSTHFTFCAVNSVLIRRQELQGARGDGPSHKGGQRSWVDSRGHVSLGCTTVKAQHHSSRQQFCRGWGGVWKSGLNQEEVSGSLSYSHFSNHCLCMVSRERREGRGHGKEAGQRQQFASEKRARKGCTFLRPFSWSMGTGVLLSLV